MPGTGETSGHGQRRTPSSDYFRPGLASLFPHIQSAHKPRAMPVTREQRWTTSAKIAVVCRTLTP